MISSKIPREMTKFLFPMLLLLWFTFFARGESFFLVDETIEEEVVIMVAKVDIVVYYAGFVVCVCVLDDNLKIEDLIFQK